MSLIDSEACPGGGQRAETDEFESGEEPIIQCPECGRRLEIGYAGLIPRHTPAAPDEC